MADEVGRVKTVVEELSKKMRLNSLSIVNDERMERSLKRVRRELRKLRCRTCEKNAGNQESEKHCQNYWSEKVKGDAIEASINTIITSSSKNASECVGWARALVDCVPSPYDDQALSFRAGEMTRVTSMREGGTWVGECGGRSGTFKFVSVKLVQEEPSPPSECSLGGLLSTLELFSWVSRLELNGFDTIQKLKAISREDLEFFEIEDSEVQDKILTIATVVRYITGDLTIGFNAFNKFFKGTESKETVDKYEADCESDNVIESSTKLNGKDVNVETCDNTDKCTSANRGSEDGNVNHVESKEISDKTSPSPTSTPSHYQSQFASTLAMFDTQPRVRYIPVCGVRGVR